MKADFRLLCALLALLGAFPLHAQNVVSPPVRRQETLDQLSAVLSDKTIYWPRAEVARLSPLSAIVAAPPPREAEPEKIIDKTERRPRHAPVVGRLSDAQALAVVAEMIQPSGAMVSTRGNRLINPRPGEIWAQGERKNVTIRGEVYSLLIETVEIDHYVLRIGNARLKQTFDEQDLDPASSIQLLPRGG